MDIVIPLARPATSDALVMLDWRHRDAIRNHLLRLSADDRFNRFLAVTSDASIRQYVDSIAFARDVVLGVKRGGAVIGLAHGSVFIQSDGDLAVDIGLSVDGGARRRGLGRGLMQGVLAAAKRCMVVRAYAVFRSDNLAVASVSRALGACVVRSGVDSCATFTLQRSAAVPFVEHGAAAGQYLQALHPSERGRVLFIHGAGGDGFQWAGRLMPQLYAMGYSVCAPTLPGHGRRSDPSAAQLPDLLGCVAKHAAEFDPSVIVGHSMGGYLVQHQAAVCPVARTVLLASFPPVALAPAELVHVQTELQCSHSPKVIGHAMRDAPDIDVSFTRPAPSRRAVAVLGGTRDRIVPESWVQRTASRYGVVASFIQAGHRLMLGEAAATVAQAIAT